MEILYYKVKPTFLSIGLIRLFVGVEFFLLIMLIYKLFTVESTKDFFTYLLAALVLLTISVIQSSKHIVYLDKDEIILQGVFSMKEFNYSEFVKVSCYSKLFGGMYIEFSDNKKYNITYKEIRSNGISNLIDNYEGIASELSMKIHDHFKSE